MMTTFSGFLGDDHHRCDELFANAEAAVDDGAWLAARTAHEAFITAINAHFAMEEEGLFPAFEAASGSTFGPTGVMRHEHEQMRRLFMQMEEALAARDSDSYLGATETLLILMQQHNAKEEQILYPMSDRMLDGERESLLARMRCIGGGDGA